MINKRIPLFFRKFKAKKEKKDLRKKAVVNGTNLSKDSESGGPYSGPEELKVLSMKYKPSEKMHLIKGKIPLIWWVNTDNFGDLLSPWLIGRMTKKEVVFGGRIENSYISIGSILKYVNKKSVVWGTGSFGTETAKDIKITANYLCVRGPLTRSKIMDLGGTCPRNYGDPALALPVFYWPEVKVKYEYGLIIRWSEEKWRFLVPQPNVKIIDLGTNDIRGTLKDILSCRNIASSSLHGLVLADAYGIPNAWLMAESRMGGSRPKGGEFKFYDYFASIDKMRHSQEMAIIDNQPVLDKLEYDGRPIKFDFERFLDSCPYLQKT